MGAEYSAFIDIMLPTNRTFMYVYSLFPFKINFPGKVDRIECRSTRDLFQIAVHI